MLVIVQTNKQNSQYNGQLKVCYEYAKRNDYNIIAEYIDRATTGTNADREQFQKMIKDSEKKAFQGVLVYQFDRFARNRYDSATYKNKLKKNGVRVISARENITDDASGILMESVLEGMAEYYSVELSQKVKRGMAINGEKCLYNGGYIEIGLKVDKESRKYQIDEETAPIVRKMFEMYRGGNTIVQIMQYLKSIGITYTKGRIRNVLENKKYIGTYTYKGKETPNVIPPIIDNELFEDVQKILTKNKKSRSRLKTKTEYILTTKLFCGHCKDMMVGISGTSRNGKVHNYYSCNNSRRKRCNKQNVTKEYIENIVVEKTRNILTDEHINEIANKIYELAQKEMNDNTNLKRLQKQMKENEQQNKNLIDSLKMCNIDSIRQSIFDEIQVMEQQHKEIEKDLLLESMQNVVITIPEIKFFLNEMRKGNVEDMRYRKMLVNTLINKVYLYDDNITFIFNSQSRPYNEKIPNIKELEEKLGAVQECSYKVRPAPPRPTK